MVLFEGKVRDNSRVLRCPRSFQHVQKQFQVTKEVPISRTGFLHETNWHAEGYFRAHQDQDSEQSVTTVPHFWGFP